MSHRHIVICFALTAALIAPAAAQTPGIQGPVTGLVFTAQTVRPLLGAPGAAVAGPTLMTGVQWASVAPSGNWGLISQRGLPARVFSLPGNTSFQVAAEGLIDGIDQAAWSRDGSYALAYSSRSAQMQRLRFSGSAVSVDAPVSLSSFGAVTTLAIDPTGSQMAFGVAGTSSAGLYLVQPQQTPVLLSGMEQPVAAAFDGTGARLYVVNGKTQTIFEFNSGVGPMAFGSLAGQSGSASNPIGLAVSGDGNCLLLTDAASQAILEYDTTSQQLTNTIPLQFAPSRMDAVSASPAFLLNGDRSNEWLMILDAGQVPRVYFVPATETRNVKEAQ